jgi:hypothetical protein
MKPTPRYDFPVSVWREGADYPSASAEAFSGVYSVTLNHTISVVFVPPVDRRPPWPPVVPPDTDNVATSDDARRMTIALSPLAVTPDDVRAQTAETFHADCDDTHAIFYVRNDEFAALLRELESLSDTFAGVHDSVPVSQLGDSALARCLTQLIIPSGHLSVRQLHIIGRRPDASRDLE